MNEISIVTGYFNINRQEWNNYKRSSKDYIKYFQKWCCIKNNLVVYIDNKDFYSSIIEAREKHGLQNKTRVIVIEDCMNIDKLLFERIKKVTSNKIHNSFRLQSQNPEVINPKYNYVMLLKEWCVADAVEKGYLHGQIAWVDFGYNHGGETIKPQSFLHFNWKYDFPSKICLFNCEEIDYGRPIFDIVRNMSVYIMGTVIVAPDYLWIKLWDYVRDSMYTLCDCGMTDDDQTILLMVFLNHSDECQLFNCDWNRQLMDYSNNKSLKAIGKTINQTGKLKKLYRSVKWKIFKLKYCIRQYKVIQPLK